MGPMPSTVMLVPMTPTRVSSTVASRRVPRNACHANIGITAKMIERGVGAGRTPGPSYPSVSTAWMNRSRAPASGSKARVSRKSGKQHHQGGRVAPKAPRAPSQRVAVAGGPGGQAAAHARDGGADGDRADQPGDVALVEQGGPRTVETAHQLPAYDPGGRHASWR